MPLFYPTREFSKLSDLTPEIVDGYGISALILDVDNTLATHNNHEPLGCAAAWLDTMRKAGIKLIIASNNTNKRVQPFAKELGLDFVANAFKPFPIGFLHAAKKLGLPAKAFGVVGDQIFTDVLGGNLFGSKTFLIEPLELEKSLPFKFKRKIESAVLRAYRKKSVQEKTCRKDDIHGSN